jgi:hypothetical protein
MRYLLILVLLAACTTPQEPAQGLPGQRIVCQEGSCTYVDACNATQDEFLAQVGPACVTHYGEEAIRSWQICTRSSSTCNCILAAQTTRSEPVDAGYRCVPHDYMDYMINAGVSGLDENGMGYDAIA